MTGEQFFLLRLMMILLPVCCFLVINVALGLFAAKYASIRGHRNWQIVSLLSIPILWAWIVSFIAIFFSRDPNVLDFSKDKLLQLSKSSDPKLRASAINRLWSYSSNDIALGNYLMEKTLKDESSYVRKRTVQSQIVDQINYITDHYDEIINLYQFEKDPWLKTVYLNLLTKVKNVKSTDTFLSVLYDDKIDIDSNDRNIAGRGLAAIYSSHSKELSQKQIESINYLLNRTIYIYDEYRFFSTGYSEGADHWRVPFTFQYYIDFLAGKEGVFAMEEYLIEKYRVY